MWDDWHTPSKSPVHLEPLSPLEPFSTVVACPHRGPIRDDSSFYCIACDAASRLNERIIRHAAASPTTEPEDTIGRLGRMIASGFMSAPEIARARIRIEHIEDAIEPEPRPTCYVPHPTLKGGVG